jgi:hypothetical protein
MLSRQVPLDAQQQEFKLALEKLNIHRNVEEFVFQYVRLQIAQETAT